jgi:hypothetical protein
MGAVRKKRIRMRSGRNEARPPTEEEIGEGGWRKRVWELEMTGLEKSTLQDFQ